MEELTNFNEISYWGKKQLNSENEIKIKQKNYQETLKNSEENIKLFDDRKTIPYRANKKITAKINDLAWQYLQKIW